MANFLACWPSPRRLSSAGPVAVTPTLQDPDRLAPRPVRLRLRDGRGRRRPFQQEQSRRRRRPDRINSTSRCHPLQLNPDRRPDLDGLPAGGRRRARPRRDRGASIMNTTQARYRGLRARTASSSRSRRISSARKSARRNSAHSCTSSSQVADRKGVDPKSVNFRRGDVPDHGRHMKSGGVDAVLTVEPFITRIKPTPETATLRRYARPTSRAPIRSSRMSRRARSPNSIRMS